MPNEENLAKIFVFTSFQGGSGKSTIAEKFARSYQEQTKLAGALIEMNLFSPSYIVDRFGLRDKLKNSFLDFFMSNWSGLRAEDIPDTFTECDKFFIIPFTDVRSNEPLKPRFAFNESDAENSMGRLLSCLTQRGCFVVIDLPLSFNQFPLFLLENSDAVFYIYDCHPNSVNLAKRFLEDAVRLKELKERVSLVKNLADININIIDGEANRFWAREFVLPTANFGAPEGEKMFEKAVQTLVSKACDIPKVPPIQRSEQHSELIDNPQIHEYKKKLRVEVVNNLEKRFGLSDQELRLKVEQDIEKAFARFPPPMVDGVSIRVDAKKYLLDEILGLGPIEDLIRDPGIDEIMVNGPAQIYIEKKGKLIFTNKQFNNSDHVKAVIDRILIPIGRVINERTPYVDGRLSDGSRIHAIIPPLSLTGPMLTIRRFSRDPYTMDDLIFRFKSFTPTLGEFLKLCIKLRKNIVISGGASSGKTTLLNVLSSFISPDERLITIEDSAELRLSQKHLGRLEARQQGTEAKMQVTIRDLVRNALRMRPDRIIVGECRGPEALDMLQAMNTGHDGSMTTLHANSTHDALSRLETMVLMAGVDLPLRAIREQISSSVNIVIQTSRLSDGSRRVVEVVEVIGIEDTQIVAKEVFKFDKKWVAEDGNIYGEILPTGYVPTFFQNIEGLEKTIKSMFSKTKGKKITSGG